MNHYQIVENLLEEAKNDANVLGFIVFGSVASGTHREDSDIDLMEILYNHVPDAWMKNEKVDGIKIGKILFTYNLLKTSVETVPYLLHIISNAKLLFDRENSIEPLLKKLKEYFIRNPNIEDEWNRFYSQLKNEKIEYGCEKTTIIDVWNELEKRHSGGEIKRLFFRFF